MWDVGGRLHGEAGARLRTALDGFDRPDPEDTPIEQRRSAGQRLADALDTLASVVLDRDLSSGTGGIARPHLSALVDAQTLRADLTRLDADEPDAADGAVPRDDPAWSALSAGETTWGDVLSPQAIRRLLCDSAVSRLVLAGPGQVLDVGRATRTWSEPQRRAVNARDRGCRGPNCSRPIGWTAVHHLHGGDAVA